MRSLISLSRTAYPAGSESVLMRAPPTRHEIGRVLRNTCVLSPEIAPSRILPTDPSVPRVFCTGLSIPRQRGPAPRAAFGPPPRLGCPRHPVEHRELIGGERRRLVRSPDRVRGRLVRATAPHQGSGWPRWKKPPVG